MRDEVGDVNEDVGAAGGVADELHDRTGDDADVVFFGEGLILLEVLLPVLAKRGELGGVGQPVCEVVFWEDGEMGAFSGGGGDEGGGFAEVEGGVEGLVERIVSILESGGVEGKIVVPLDAAG